jgi:hypothetical protein
MDNETESWRAKLLIGAVIVFLISCIFVFTEFMYLVDSRETTATISKAYKVQIRGRFGIVKGYRLAVEYDFVDAEGLRRSGRCDVNEDWPIPLDGKVKIRYRPGEDGASRFVGFASWTAIIIFFVCLAAVGVFGYRLVREANRAYAPRRGKK